jgi:hypothetical protein
MEEMGFEACYTIESCGEGEAAPEAAQLPGSNGTPEQCAEKLSQSREI